MIRKTTLLLAAIAVAALSLPVLGQDASSVYVGPSGDTHVTYLFGDFIGRLGVELVPWVATIVVGLLGALIVKFFPAAGVFITAERTKQVEQLLERALGYAASKNQQLLKGRTLDLDVKNAVVADAAEYALEHGSKKVLDFAGSTAPGAIEQKLQARLLTSPAVQAAQGVTPTSGNASVK